MFGRVLAAVAAVGLGWAGPTAQADDSFARDPAQATDAAYAAKIARYTTDPSFNTPLTDYLPASTTVPTPEAVLGDIAGAPDLLPYATDVHRYFRLLDKCRAGKATGFADNQAFVGILSTMLLDETFVQRSL